MNRLLVKLIFKTNSFEGKMENRSFTTCKFKFSSLPLPLLLKKRKIQNLHFFDFLNSYLNLSCSYSFSILHLFYMCFHIQAKCVSLHSSLTFFIRLTMKLWLNFTSPFTTYFSTKNMAKIYLFDKKFKLTFCFRISHFRFCLVLCTLIINDYIQRL